jgi:hypothetical protein
MKINLKNVIMAKFTHNSTTTTVLLMAPVVHLWQPTKVLDEKDKFIIR